MEEKKEKEKKKHWIENIPVIGTEIEDWRNFKDTNAIGKTWNGWIEGWKKTPMMMIDTTITWTIITLIMAMAIIMIDQDIKECNIITKQYTTDKGVITTSNYTIPFMQYIKEVKQIEESTTPQSVTTIKCTYHPIKEIQNRLNKFKEYNKYQKSKSEKQINITGKEPFEGLHETNN